MLASPSTGGAARNSAACGELASDGRVRLTQPPRRRGIVAAELRDGLRLDLHPLHLRVRAPVVDPAALFQRGRNSATIPGRSRQPLPTPLPGPDTYDRATRSLAD